MSKAGKPRLGRGLSSLMSTPVAVDPPTDEQVSQAPTGGSEQEKVSESSQGAGPDLVWLSVEAIEPNPFQPRQRFDERALEDLAGSIKQDGLMQPIVVRAVASDAGGASAGRYQLVAGERRWRAAKLAGLEQVPALVRELDDQQIAEWAVIENLQREDLNPIERAEAFSRLIERFELRHEDVADRVGVNRATVTNTLRLLELHGDVRDLVRTGQLSGGHAKALLGVSDHEVQVVVANHAVAEGWSVRMIETEVRQLGRDQPLEKTPPKQQQAARSAHLEDLQRQVAEQLGTKVKIKAGRKKGSGSLTIDFYDLDQFDTLLTKLGVNID